MPSFRLSPNSNSNKIQGLLDEGVREGVFPGCVLFTAAGGEPGLLLTAGRLSYFPGAPVVRPDTVYDLASLTKILSTTYLTMLYFDQGRLNLGDTLVDLGPGAVPEDKRDRTLEQLLSHSTGFPAWRPFYKYLEKMKPEDRRREAWAWVLAENAEAGPDEIAIYSDLNFILLGLILEHLGGIRQDDLFDDMIARPLGLELTGYRPFDRESVQPEGGIAPTETGPRRSGPVGGQLGEPRMGVPPGWVHDDNAAALGGVAGHAGLFGTAGEVWRIFDSIRRSYLGESGGRLKRETVRLFWEKRPTPPGTTRALGFDTPSLEGSSAGSLFSRQSVGHLGFTGTSLWHDPEKDLTVILLSNRVHPSAANQKILQFRPKLHDLVHRAFFSARGGYLSG